MDGGWGLRVNVLARLQAWRRRPNRLERLLALSALEDALAEAEKQQQEEQDGTGNSGFAA
jgi:hypothetical protein